MVGRHDSAAGAPEQPREMTHLRTTVVLQSRQFSSSSSPDTPRTQVVLQLRQFSSSSSPHTPRTKVVLESRQFSSSSSPIALSPAFRALDAHDLHRGLSRGPGQIALSPALRSLDTHDLRRGLRRTKPNRTLACISRTRHARSPQRVAFRGAPAALPPALREKVKKSER